MAQATTLRIKKSTLKISIAVSLGVIVVLLVLNKFAGSIGGTTGSTSLWAIFLTGLITGGLTCMAVQGGLLAATIAQREEERLKEKVKTYLGKEV